MFQAKARGEFCSCPREGADGSCGNRTGKTNNSGLTGGRRLDTTKGKKGNARCDLLLQQKAKTCGGRETMI